MREIFNPEINVSALQEIEGSKYTLPGKFVRELLEGYLFRCKQFRCGVDYDYRLEGHLPWSSIVDVLSSVTDN